MRSRCKTTRRESGSGRHSIKRRLGRIRWPVLQKATADLDKELLRAKSV
jgi:hypothetical protein